MDKNLVVKIILEFLKKNPKSQYGAIKNKVMEYLEKDGEIGFRIRPVAEGIKSRTVRISDADAMLINEVVYDLIVERILTPGIDRDNLEWPFLSVTSMDKLMKKLKELS